MEASRGYGPALPLPQLAFALGVDRVRGALRITAAAVRLHPSQTLLPTAAVAVLMAFFVLASANSQIQLTQRAGLDGVVSGAGSSVVAAAPATGQLGITPSQLGPIVGSGSASVAAGLPGGQWGIKPAALGHAAGLRVGQACFGAMPGVGSAQAVQLACKPALPSAAGS